MSEEGIKYDSGKLRYGLVDVSAHAWLTAVLTYGAVRYAAENWRVVSNGQERYYDALLRHLVSWKSGELVDAETGLPHLGHAICNVMFLLALEHPATQLTITAAMREAVRRISLSEK